jgi:hypothetical protein
VKTQTIRAMVLMLLETTALAGCGERAASRVTPQAEPAGTVTAVTAAAPPTATAPAASTAPTACPAPAFAEPARPAPEPRRTTTLAADERLSVKRLVIAAGVKDREPVGAGTTFKGDAHKVYAFVEVENRGGAPGEIVVEFEPPGGGAARGDVRLAVGSAARWRTWAYTRSASTTGSWTAVVKNRKGEVLARAPFEVTL